MKTSNGDTLHNGDSGEYIGRVKRLKGKRCTVHERTVSGKSARVFFEIDGRPVRRTVRLTSLKRLGGGVLESKEEG